MGVVEATKAIFSVVFVVDVVVVLAEHVVNGLL